MFHPTDTFHLLAYFGYPLSFVQSMDTLDQIRMDSLNLSIGTIDHAYGLIVCQVYKLSMRMCALI